MDLPAAVAFSPPGTGATPDIHGLTDTVTRDRIYGWAMDGACPDHRLKVELRLGEMVLGAVTADILRQDLMDNQVGDGRYGFEFTVPTELMQRSPEFKVVAITATGQEVPIAMRLRRVNPRATANAGRPEGRAELRPNASAPDHRRLREELATLAKRLDAMPDAKSLGDAVSQHTGMADKLRDLQHGIDQRLAATPETARLDQFGVQQGLLAERLLALETWLARIDQRLTEPATPVAALGSKRGLMDGWQKALFLALGAALALALGVSLILRGG